MAQGSDVRLDLEVDGVDLIPEALELARMGILPAGMYRNRHFAEAGVDAGDVELARQDLLYDPQTAGGLLISVAAEDAPALLRDLQGAAFPVRSARDSGGVCRRKADYSPLTGWDGGQRCVLCPLSVLAIPGEPTVPGEMCRGFLRAAGAQCRPHRSKYRTRFAAVSYPLHCPGSENPEMTPTRAVRVLGPTGDRPGMDARWPGKRRHRAIS